MLLEAMTEQGLIQLRGELTELVGLRTLALLLPR